MKFWTIVTVATALTFQTYNSQAQLPDKVGSLITVDRDAAKLSQSSNPHQAFLSIVDKESVFLHHLQ